MFDRAEGGKIEGLDAAVAGALAGAVAQIATTPVKILLVVMAKADNSLDRFCSSTSFARGQWWKRENGIL
jgi:hypothetical protein